MLSRKEINELDDDIIQMAKEGCDGCKGIFYFHDSDCRYDCEVFIQNVEEIIKESEE